MKNQINQISLGCAVNSAIINDVVDKSDFIESCVNVPLKHNIQAPSPNTPWPFQNSSWEAYKLYCMIVVPKELYKLPATDDFYQNLKAKKMFRNFEVIKEKDSFEDSPLYHFNSLRNAISHVNFSLKGMLEYEFWDHFPHKTDRDSWHWHVKISGTDMHLFLGEIAEFIIAIYNEIQQGIRDQDTYAKL